MPGACVDRVVQHAEMVWEASTSLGLTSLRDPETFAVRHVLDSVLPAAFLPLDDAVVLDVGSGAGYPGVPLACMGRAARVVLAESRGRKASFLDTAAKALDANLEVHPGRAEEWLGAETCDLAVVRAVGSPRAVFRALGPAAKAAAAVALWAGPGADDLVAGAAREAARRGHALADQLSYDLGPAHGKRTLLLYRRAED